MQKLTRRSQNKSSTLAVKLEQLQQFPALKWKLEEKDDLIASLAEQLAAAQESATGSTCRDDEHFAQLRTKWSFLSFVLSLAWTFGLMS